MCLRVKMMIELVEETHSLIMLFFRYSVTTLTVSRGGRFSSQLSFLQKIYKADILENTPLNSVVLTLGVSGIVIET